MPRKKKQPTVVEPKPKYFVDGHGDVQEYYDPPKPYEIDWNKIAANVKEAAELVKKK